MIDKKFIDQIQKRNKKVEADKAWETSLTRRIIITTLTYLVMVSTMYFVLHSAKPFLDAIIPTLGFILSTLGLGAVKKVWLKHIYKK